MRKFGYSEHCVYTGAILSFICILFWFLEIHFGSEGFCFDIWGFTSGTAFSFGFLEDYEKHGDASAWSEKEWCIVMHGLLRT